ncbi:catalytic protein [Xylariomycetidae sp. FL2044]|nr:catalytic protein [Xylariomycetidae sp. FL2044]
MPSSPPAQKPTIVLVQGAFQTPEPYHKLADALRAAGYHVVQPRLPSLTSDVDHAVLATKDLRDDARVVRDEVRRLVEGEEDGREVVVFMHSYGGLVGSEAVTRDLSSEDRRSRSLAGGVVHLFYCAAFILSEGQSFKGALGDASNRTQYDDNPEGLAAMKNAGEILYHDLPADEAKYWESKIIYQSEAIQTTELTNAAWRYVPSTYLLCERDRGPPAPLQEVFAKTAGSQVLRMDCGHSPMLSHTAELVDMVDRAAQTAAAKGKFA